MISDAGSTPAASTTSTSTRISDYFKRKIKPGLTSHASPKHHLLRPLSPAGKFRLLSRAKCLLHPTLTPETSSLMTMEALAAGCPLIAYRSAALAEIVEDGVTGFLVNNVDEMAAAIRYVAGISRSDSRNKEENRFGKDRMIRAYPDIYESAAALQPASCANVNELVGTNRQTQQSHPDMSTSYSDFVT